ncbi:hypothetical protein MNBD_GAMMA26-1642 [hydrothermal vent metagenome]|uniref:Rhodanese domain-containing protein n=1 Tax=hydrothermal vent metagenome TaxID=652676 RepID=A0A3B1B5T0_9ZZZZ
MEQFTEFVGNNFTLFLVLAVIIGLLTHNLMSGFDRSIIVPARATELINREEAVVVDTSAMADFAKGHIINAINIPFNGFKDQINQLQKHKQAPVIIVDRTGTTSGSICKMLKADGFEQVYQIKGGLGAWRSANLPVSKKA